MLIESLDFCLREWYTVLEQKNRNRCKCIINENLFDNIEIIDSEIGDWIFSVKQENGESETYVILRNNSGSKWTELWGNIDDYHCLIDYITTLPDVTIIEHNTKEKHLKYQRDNIVFSITYIGYVHQLIDPHWDGEPYIEFKFVEKTNPHFKTYACEVLSLRRMIQTNQQKKSDT